MVDQEKLEQLIALCEKLTEDVITLKESNENLSEEVKTLRNQLGVKSKEEEEADDEYAEEMLKKISIVGKDMCK